MQRALYRLEDRLFYRGATLARGFRARFFVGCSVLVGSIGDHLPASQRKTSYKRHFSSVYEQGAH
jgi:hypothetical protein